MPRKVDCELVLVPPKGAEVVVVSCLVETEVGRTTATCFVVAGVGAGTALTSAVEAGNDTSMASANTWTKVLLIDTGVGCDGVKTRVGASTSAVEAGNDTIMASANTRTKVLLVDTVGCDGVKTRVGASTSAVEAGNDTSMASAKTRTKVLLIDTGVGCDGVKTRVGAVVGTGFEPLLDTQSVQIRVAGESKQQCVCSCLCLCLCRSFRCKRATAQQRKAAFPVCRHISTKSTCAGRKAQVEVE
jgi:hypothetical protein